jgi:hypothetical protein
MPKLQQDREAWEAGFHAGAAGERGKCPHPPGTVERWSWEAGFVEGKASRRNPARKRTDENDQITRAVEILRAVYVPSVTRGALAEAVGEVLDILDAGGDAFAA